MRHHHDSTKTKVVAGRFGWDIHTSWPTFGSLAFFILTSKMGISKSSATVSELHCFSRNVCPYPQWRWRKSKYICIICGVECNVKSDPVQCVSKGWTIEISGTGRNYCVEGRMLPNPKSRRGNIVKMAENVEREA